MEIIWRLRLLISRPVKSSYPDRISYCSADATFTHVFAFIAVNRSDCLQCYAFLARKQKIVSP